MKYKLLRFSLMCILAMLRGVVHADYYQKVMSTTDITNGDYLIVYEEGSVAFNGGLTTLDAVSNTVAITIESNKIASSATVDAATFTITSTDNGYTVRSASGNYIGQTSYANGLKQAAALATGYYHAISIDGGNAVFKITTSGGDVTLRYNKASDQNRFRFFKNGQQAIQLYKKVAESSDTRIATTLTLDEHQYTGEVDGSMNLPTATVMAGETEVTGASIVWESSNTNVATIADGKINFIAAGTAKITATYAGNETNYKPSTASFDLTVTPVKVTISSFTTLQEKVTENSTPATITFNGEKVVYVNGSNAYLADANGLGALLYTKNHGLEVGQTLTGTIDAAIQLYQGAAEITNFTKEGLTIGTAAVAPVEKAIGEVVKANQSTLVTLKNVTASVSSDGKTITLSDGEKTITYFDKFKTSVAIKDGKTYDVIGVVVLFNDVIEICPRTTDDVVETITEPAEFQDFAVIVNNQSGTLLTSEEQVQGTAVEFGVAVDADGNTYRVAANDAKSIANVSGSYHSEHGMTGMKVVTAVPGAVKILVGQCTYSGNEIKVTDSNGDVVVSATPTTACWKNDRQNVTELIYKGEATTLTITGMGYCPFISVETVDPSQLVTDATVTFAAGEAGSSAFVPEAIKQEVGKKITLPKNFTMYVEGKTLTGWSDGEQEYAVGSEYTVPENDVTLTAVFTTNEVSLADRTEPVTVKFDFLRQNGAPTVGFEGKTGIWVAQAIVNGKTIDVKADFDTTNGKFANGGWTDWAQLNNGTIFTVPSCKDAIVSMEAFNEITTTTIDGQNDYTSANTISYTIAGAAETVDVVIGDGSYYRYIQVVLPVVQSQGGGESYDNVAGSVIWAIGNEATGTVSDDFADAFSATSSAIGTGLNVSTKTIFNQAMLALKPSSDNPGNDVNNMVEYRVKVAAGLTFKPTSVTYDAVKNGTDNASYSYSYVIDGMESAITTVPKEDIIRNNNITGTPPMNHSVAITTDGCSEFAFRIYVSGFAAKKDLDIANIIILGTINGTAAVVNKYTLATATAPVEGGSVNVYPAAEEYEEGSTIKLTAAENFGYDFVNWTNADNEVVSTESVYTFDIAKDETLTANFQAVETYELALTVDGTNDYMVTIDPAPTMVDGKMMYEAGTAVQLTANSYEGLVMFNNWSDGETGSSKLISMTADTELTAVYSQADIIAGWDFYKKGNEGRIADFASEMNATSALSLVNTESGDAKGWLDKSTEAAGGYEGFKGAAVNWNVGASDGDVGHYHWQTKVNAKDFTNIKVQFQMLYNYNAYQTYNAEYSLDGESWSNFGSITMTGTKSPISFNGLLPDDCNNQAEVYIRMIADKTSKVDGSSSKNDGNTLAMFFITGTQALVDDGKAPVLVTTVPADGATGVSASGKVVLTFDEKVMVSSDAAATLGSQILTPVVSGKTISFEYKGLEYSTEYTFTLPIYTVSDLTNNAIDVPISFSFTTMERPTVTKGLYDAVVEDADGLLAAIAAADSRSDKNVRYRIFLKNGTYKLPQSTTETIHCSNGNDYPSPITKISSSNISFIGESRDGVIVTNTVTGETYTADDGGGSVYEKIGNSDVLQLQGSVRGTYFQDLTVKSGIGDALGRNLAIQDKGSQTIYKNTVLWGYQDTWNSNNDNGYYYFEGGKVRGRTDFLCGKGDAFFNAVDIQICMATGGYIAVPSKSIKYGYVFKDCNILCENSALNGKYTLGRPWGQGTPVALWIDTKMQYAPSAIGWSEMSNGWPKQFAEWNSTLTTGTSVDLSGRKTTFGEGHANVPVLTAEEALEAGNLHNMFGEWDPTLATEQAPVPQNVKQEGNNLVWDNSNYALLWAIVKDGAVIDFTTEPTYELTESGTYAVRAANEMGGLSEASESVVATVTEVVKVTLNASGYATLASAKALDFSAVEGLMAYIVKEQTADKAMLTSVDATPAETGLVLKGAAGTEYTIPVATSATSIEGNLLVAAVTATAVDAKSVYVLDGDKFKVFTGTEIPAGKAYLPMNGNARLLELVFSDATAIGSVNVDVNANQIYDLQGRRVKTPSKGVYVVDGKKVIIK